MKLKLALVALVPAMLAACSDAPEPAAETEAQAPLEVVVPSGDYTLDRRHASLHWAVPHMGLADYVVRMTDIDAQLTLDTENPSNSSITLTINPQSVAAHLPGEWDAAERGYASWDAEIAENPDFLAGADGTPITFTSTSVEPTGPNTADVTGDLTFRGVTAPVTMHAELTGQLEQHPFGGMPAVGFKATGTMKPTDFGMGLMNGALEDVVKVEFNGEFHGPAPEAEAPAEEEAAAE